MTTRNEHRAVARAAVAKYREAYPGLVEATDQYVDLVKEMLDDAGINYLSVTGRTKTVESFRGKAMRWLADGPAHPDPTKDITDAIGVRVITFVQADVSAVADLLRQDFAVLDDRDLGLETARAGRWGYASRHMLVAVDASRTVPARIEPLLRLSASVQIRTVLQHAWAEFEHDIRYKGTIPEEYASDLDRRFTLAAGLLELADREFSAIRDQLLVALPAEPERDEPERDGAQLPRIGVQDLAKFLAQRYTDAGWSRGDHYEWVAGLLAELGISSVDALEEVLAPVDQDALTAKMGYKYPAGAVRRLDDALLEIYGVRYLGLEGNLHRRAALESRLDKLRD